MNEPRLKILISASVPIHFRYFHFPWVRRLRELGCTVIGVADQITTQEDCVKEFSEVYNVPFSRNPLNFGAARVAEKAVAQVIESREVDLLHVHTPVAAFVSRKAAQPFRGRGLKSIYMAHGFHFHDHGKWYMNLIFQFLEKRAGKWTDYLVVINKDDENAARRLKIVPDERIVYIPGVGVDLNQYSPARVKLEDVQRVRAELNLASTDKVVAVVAELIRRKRQGDVITALTQLNRPDIHLLLVGDGKNEPELRAQVEQLGLNKSVHFLGRRKDVATLLRASNCSVLASAHEGLSRSVMESLSLEVPVIGSDVRGIRDLIAPGGGILFPVGETVKLAEAILELVDNPEKARRLGAVGRASMKTFELQNVIRLNEKLYERALGERFAKLMRA